MAIILRKGAILKLIYALPLFLVTITSFAQEKANYLVSPGMLHTKGAIMIEVLPDPIKYKVQINFDVKKKSLVPVPSKLLKGKTAIEFPSEFRTEAGYKILEQRKKMEVPKAILKFVKRADFKDLKDAYFIEVRPTNKKSKIDIVYHPSLPAVGWSRVQLTFLSNIPVLNGYELEALLKR